MKIVCKISDICIKSVNPNFKYRFGKSGVPVEVEECHVDKILLNSDFYDSNTTAPRITAKSVKSKSNKNLNTSKDKE